jgi:hypothetical protein
MEKILNKLRLVTVNELTGVENQYDGVSTIEDDHEKVKVVFWDGKYYNVQSVSTPINIINILSACDKIHKQQIETLLLMS